MNANKDTNRSSHRRKDNSGGEKFLPTFEQVRRAHRSLVGSAHREMEEEGKDLESARV